MQYLGLLIWWSSGFSYPYSMSKILSRVSRILRRYLTLKQEMAPVSMGWKQRVIFGWRKVIIIFSGIPLDLRNTSSSIMLCIEQLYSINIQYIPPFYWRRSVQMFFTHQMVTFVVIQINKNNLKWVIYMDHTFAKIVKG